MPSTWVKRTEHRLVLLALAVRCGYILLCCALDQLLHDYDSSKFIEPGAPNGSASRTALLSVGSQERSILSGLVVWDAVFFKDISTRGYPYEQYFAFFPFLPGLTRAFKGLGLDFGATVVSLNALSSACTALLLYRLGLRVLRSKRLALLASVFFILNPALVFHAAPYTESLFALFSVAVPYLLCCHGSLITASIAAMLSSCVRSNGAVNCGFLMHYQLRRAVRAYRKQAYVRAVLHVVLGAVASVLGALPVAAFQYYGYRLFCMPAAPQYHHGSDIFSGHDGSGSAHGGDGGSAHGGSGAAGAAASPGAPQRPWCVGRLPSVYNFVQAEYWVVGFLKYYRLSQVPNFLLAAPVLLLSLWGCVAHICCQQPSWVLLGALGDHHDDCDENDGAGNGADTDYDGYVVHDRDDLRHGDDTNCGDRDDRGLKDGNDGGDSLARSTGGGGVRDEGQRGGSSISGGGNDEGKESSSAAAMRRRKRGGKQDAGQQQQQQQQQQGVAEAAAAAGRLGSDRSIAADHGAQQQQAPDGFFSRRVTVFVYPWMFMLVVAATVMHVQVATRFLSSAPPLYWWMAHLWQQHVQRQDNSTTPIAGSPGTLFTTVGARRQCTGGEGVVGSKAGSMEDMQGGGAAQDAHQQHQRARCMSASPASSAKQGRSGRRTLHGAVPVLVWAWCLLYAALGAVLFPNFYPWT